MPSVGEHTVPKGPSRTLARLRGRTVGRARQRASRSERGAPRAGHPGAARVHWLDELGNPIHWDGLHTVLHAVEPAAAGGDARRCAGRSRRGYRIAFDLVDEGTCWFSEVGNLAPELGVVVQPRIERALRRSAATRRREGARRAGGALGPGRGRGGRAARARVRRRGTGRGASSTHTRRLRAGRRLIGAQRGSGAGAAGAGAVGAGRWPRPAFAYPLVCPSIVRGVGVEWQTRSPSSPRWCSREARSGAVALRRTHRHRAALAHRCHLISVSLPRLNGQVPRACGAYPRKRVTYETYLRPAPGLGASRRTLARLRGRYRQGRSARPCARRARERGAPPLVAPPGAARVSLAGRARQPDPLGRPPHRAAAPGRAWRPARGDARPARADPAGELSHRLRPRRRGHLLVQRGGQPRAGARGRRTAADRARACGGRRRRGDREGSSRSRRSRSWI